MLKPGYTPAQIRLDCVDPRMTEIELMNCIAEGAVSFTREDYADFDEIDAQLRTFVSLGYVGKIMRSLSETDGPEHAHRVDIVGGLTPVGELRRRQLFPMAIHPGEFFSRCAVSF